MQQILSFVLKYRVFLLFLLLEGFCAWMIVSHNRTQRIAFFSSANVLTGTILNVREGVSSYFKLRSINDKLSTENARLKAQIAGLRANRFHQDSTFLDQYEYITARVIKNSVSGTNNYITINKGEKDGVREGMGVVSPEGVIGKVENVSRHYAGIRSLLHTKMPVSSVIGQPGGALGSVKWEGRDYTEAQLDHITRHVKVKKGDSIFTSGENAVFPPHYPIGIVSSVRDNRSKAFQDVGIRLFPKFNALDVVYLLKNRLRNEQDSLEQQSLKEFE